MGLSEEGIQRILTKIMVPGKKYTVNDLENLMGMYYEARFDDYDNELVTSEKRERWRILVKNSVRRCPDRKFRTNSWRELKLQRTSPKRFHYYIEAGAEDLAFEIERPKDCDWWGAEMAVMSNLRERGWTVSYMGNQRVGYDILATDEEGHETYVEVKSSSGKCSPEFTEGEWRKARDSGQSYLVAILEHFDPVDSGGATISYISNPSSLEVSESRVLSYRLNRGTWKKRIN